MCVTDGFQVPLIRINESRRFIEIAIFSKKARFGVLFYQIRH